MGSGTSTQNKNQSNNKNEVKQEQKSSGSNLNQEAQTSKEPVKAPIVQTPPTAVNMPDKRKKAPAKMPAAESTNQKTDENELDKDFDEIFPEDQQKFDNAIRFACELIKAESILKYAKPGLEKIDLMRSLPSSVSTFSLLSHLKHLQILNLSGNQIGPAGFNAIMLGLCQNTSIKTLNIADNQTDTNCSETIGQALSNNSTLTCLDVSGNYLGKDYFSRCVGPSLAENNTLQVLKCESIGATDFTVLGENLKKNRSLVSLNVNSNELSNSKPFIQSLAECLQSSDNSIEVLEVKNTGIKPGCIQLLTDALQKNNSLTLLNITLNQLANTTELMNLVVTCLCHKTMKKLIADDIKIAQVDSWNAKGEVSSDLQCTMKELSLFGCSLKDEHFTTLLKHMGQGKLCNLCDINVGNNVDITEESLKVLCALTSVPEPVAENSEEQNEESNGQDIFGPSCLTRLNLSHNNVDKMIEYLCTKPFPNLKYLNLRRCKVVPSSIGQLSSCVKQGGLETLVLDAVKLSGSDAFKLLLADKPKLAALSLSSCQLSDDDLQPLWASIKSDGLPIHMLKLSANRVTDKGIDSMCDALQGHKTHPLALIDLSTNNVESPGAKRLSELLKHKKHKSQLHSVNLANNNIKGDGVAAVISCITKSSLLSVNCCNQKCGYEEQDMENIFEELVKVLGIKPVQENGSYKLHASDLPNLPPGISIKLQSLGGETGELGKYLDSSAILTDNNKMKLPNLTLHHALEIASALKQCDSAECLLSSSEWNTISGLNKDAPSWLQVADNRARAVYLTGLPAAITTQKMEGLLEMEADCNVDEICLMKDTVTRKNNGNAWVLFSDEDSAAKAFQYYIDGQALVFSTPFAISRINVRVDDGASSEAEAKAKQEMEKRLQDKKKEEAAHKTLIHRAYIESQERHAYRLAHPAYADGRIW